MRSCGTPSILIICCAKCQAYLMSYQKDGPGPLLRCYLDRIHHPDALAQRQHETFEKKSFPKLTCTSCESVIGFPVTYKKEKRAAYHLVPTSFVLKRL